jgi:hypothetical protein
MIPPRLWKNLGKSAGKAVRIAQHYAQKSSIDATKVLVPQGFLIDHRRHGSREHRPVRSGTGCPSGGGRTARDRGGSVYNSPSGEFSGRCCRRSPATAASRRALPGPADHTATPASLTGQPSRRRIRAMRSSGRVSRVGDRRDSRRCALNGARHKARPGAGGVPPGRRRRWARAHPLVEPGSRQRLLEGRRTAREGVPAPLAFLRGRGGER